MECRELILSEIRFDPDVHEVSPEQQPLEPDLVRAQRDIHWAEHLVFVYPTWRKAKPGVMTRSRKPLSRAGKVPHHVG